ncbi:unnamed protein product, partial [Prorocentrum cordatum]
RLRRRHRRMSIVWPRTGRSSPSLRCAPPSPLAPLRCRRRGVGGAMAPTEKEDPITLFRDLKRHYPRAEVEDYFKDGRRRAPRPETAERARGLAIEVSHPAGAVPSSPWRSGSQGLEESLAQPFGGALENPVEAAPELSAVPVALEPEAGVEGTIENKADIVGASPQAASSRARQCSPTLPADVEEASDPNQPPSLAAAVSKLLDVIRVGAKQEALQGNDDGPPPLYQDQQALRQDADAFTEMVMKGFQQAFTGMTAGTTQMKVRFERPMPSAQELCRCVQNLHGTRGPQVVVQLLEQQRVDKKGKRETFTKPLSATWLADTAGWNSTNFHLKLDIL